MQSVTPVRGSVPWIFSGPVKLTALFTVCIGTLQPWTGDAEGLWRYVGEAHGDPGHLGCSLVSALLTHWAVNQVLSPGPEVEEEVTHLHGAGQALHHHLVTVGLEETPGGQDVSRVESVSRADRPEGLGLCGVWGRQECPGHVVRDSPSRHQSPVVVSVAKRCPGLDWSCPWHTY